MIVDKIWFYYLTNKTMENNYLINLFLDAKKVEWCSNKTLLYYQMIVKNVIKEINKDIRDITTEELRNYLSLYKEINNCSLITIDNVRRVLSSFYGRLEEEDYIVKSPVRKIHKVKTQKVVKSTYTDENIEIMRDNCNYIRNLAIIELLFITWIRVGELVNLNKFDINWEERSCIVLWKGNKEREVYFDARTKIHLQKYLNERHDRNSALFVSRRKPHQRLTISAIELIVRKLGKISHIDKSYPHKFRRTLATRAIDKWMPVEQVQRLLWHAKIDTTMGYAMVNQNNVKLAHRKYLW